MAKSRKFRQSGVGLYDTVKTRYHMWDPVAKFSYLVKLRPFVKYFLEMALADFEIYFYTAATRSYGDLAVQILKLEMQSQEISDLGLKRRVENTFLPGRLISRDDKERFQESKTAKDAEMELEQLRQAEKNVIQNGGVNSVNPFTLQRELLKMNFMRKTLDALAGGDDKIYVILDDREDVWLEDDGRPSANLLKILPYYYHQET